MIRLIIGYLAVALKPLPSYGDFLWFTFNYERHCNGSVASTIIYWFSLHFFLNIGYMAVGLLTLQTCTDFLYLNFNYELHDSGSNSSHILNRFSLFFYIFFVSYIEVALFPIQFCIDFISSLQLLNCYYHPVLIFSA